MLAASNGSTERATTRLRFTAASAGAVLGSGAVLVAAPLIGWPPVVRVPAVLVPALVVAALAAAPWRFADREWPVVARWHPRPATIALAAALLGLLLFWVTLTRFRSGLINGVDFTVYFDRPCYQTVYRHRPLFVETADVASFANRSELAVHAFWAMFAVCAPYAIYPTPYWLLLVAVTAVVAGALHVFRIARELRWNGVLASATALAFVFNDNMARAVNGGFHPELLYAWCIPWLIDAGLRRARASYLGAALACLLVKEDACFVVFAAATGLLLAGVNDMSRRDKLLFLVVPTTLALLNLAVFYQFVVPVLTADRQVTYAAFWANYGRTPIQALMGMFSHPWHVLRDTASSGFFGTLVPHLFLPVLGWRWLVGAVPVVLLYGASANPQLRGFGVYYAVVLIPFLALAASSGALLVARRFASTTGSALCAAGAVLFGTLLVGSSHAGYSLRPWRADIASMHDAVALLASERVVLVESDLYAHAGYSPRVQLLTPESLRDPQNCGAAILVSVVAGGYPFTREQLHELVVSLPAIRELPSGLVALRNRRNCSEAADEDFHVELEQSVLSARK